MRDVPAVCSGYRRDGIAGLRQRLECSDIAKQLGLDRRPLHLDSDLHTSILFRQHGPVDLRDARRAQRLVVKLDEDVLPFLVLEQQLLRDDGLHQRWLHRVDEIGQAGEAVGVLLREEVGARVEVVGESRVKLEDIASREPFITGIFTHVPQMGDVGTYVPSEAEMAQVKEVTDYVENAVGDVLTLSDKLLSGTEEGEGEEDGDAFDGIWTHKEAGDLRSAMAWVDAPAVTLEDIEDGDVSMDAADWTRVEDGFAHSALSRAERLSFAVLQVAPASTSSDLQKLIACRAVAMSTDHGLLDRLRLGVSVLDDQLASLRAKVALKNLGSTL